MISTIPLCLLCSDFGKLGNLAQCMKEDPKAGGGKKRNPPFIGIGNDKPWEYFTAICINFYVLFVLILN